MNKIPTLFLRNPKNMKLVTEEVDPAASWVLEGEGVPTQKMDGTNVRVTIQGEQCVLVEKRRNPTREQKANGAEPGYVEANRNDPSDIYIFQAAEQTIYSCWHDGIYSCEALGPMIQGGVEHVPPMLYPFTFWPRVLTENPRTYSEMQNYLTRNEMEGIVWHHPDGRMAKIKRRDFNLPWPALPWADRKV